MCTCMGMHMSTCVGMPTSTCVWQIGAQFAVSRRAVRDLLRAGELLRWLQNAKASCGRGVYVYMACRPAEELIG